MQTAIAGLRHRLPAFASNGDTSSLYSYNINVLSGGEINLQIFVNSDIIVNDSRSLDESITGSIASGKSVHVVATVVQSIGTIFNFVVLKNSTVVHNTNNSTDVGTTVEYDYLSEGYDVWTIVAQIGL